ncbi:MAG: hypothetical protein PVK01_01790 [Flavobacteriaceae bacterium]|jgi:hypothetical protein
MRLVVLFVILFFQVGFGQQTQSPFEAVQDFFEAFHHQDFKALSHSFSSSAVLQRATYIDGQSILRNQDVSQFINRVVTRPDIILFGMKYSENLRFKELRILLPFGFPFDFI